MAVTGPGGHDASISDGGAVPDPLLHVFSDILTASSDEDSREEDSAKQREREKDGESRLKDEKKSVEIDQTRARTEDIRKTNQLREKYAGLVYGF